MQIAPSLRETISEKIDWLAFTVQFYKDIQWPPYITVSWKVINPIAKFTNGNENSQGVRVYWNVKRPNMGKHIILSGSCCTTIGDNLRELLSYVLAEEFTVTRLDLCVDVRHTHMKAQGSTKYIKKGEVITHAQKFRIETEALDRGYTQYIGSAGGAAFVRIYDKASEMGVSFPWVRIELQIGKRKGKSATKAYLENDDIRGMVRDFVHFPTWKKWVSVFSSPKVEIRYEHSPTNTRLWIMDTVAKCVAREMTLESDQEFYLQFLQRIREEFYSLTKHEQDVDF